MRIVVPSTGPLGDRLEVWTVAEPDDPKASFPWTVCVRRLDGSVVYEQSVYHTVRIDPDIKVHTIDISGLGRGVYLVNVYNHTSCDPPDGVDTYVVYIHKEPYSVMLRMHADWYPERSYIFTMYVYDGKIFYSSRSGRTASIPKGVDVYVEATGSDGRAFVGVVKSDSDYVMSPNASIPFESAVVMKFNSPVAWAVARFVSFPVRHVAVSVVDDYTLKLVFVKSDVGIAPLVAGIVMLALVGVIVALVAYIVSMWVSVEVGRQKIVDRLVEERDRVVDMYLDEVNRCTDEQCVNSVMMKYMPILTSINQAIGEVYGRECGGVELFGRCVPWYVFVVVLVAALAVVMFLTR